MIAAKLTAAQLEMLSALPAYVTGSANVQNARRLESMGLVDLHDDGRVRGNRDGERWLVTITDAGRAVRDDAELLRGAS